MKEKTIVSTATLVTSLLAYWYARETHKDTSPYIILGGFLGSLIGETIVERRNKRNNTE
jgi:uncharacterized membrane protein YfcA